MIKKIKKGENDDKKGAGAYLRMQEKADYGGKEVENGSIFYNKCMDLCTHMEGVNINKIGAKGVVYKHTRYQIKSSEFFYLIPHPDLEPFELGRVAAKVIGRREYSHTYLEFFDKTGRLPYLFNFLTQKQMNKLLKKGEIVMKIVCDIEVAYTIYEDYFGFYLMKKVDDLAKKIMNLERSMVEESNSYHLVKDLLKDEIGYRGEALENIINSSDERNDRENQDFYGYIYYCHTQRKKELKKAINNYMRVYSYLYMNINKELKQKINRADNYKILYEGLVLGTQWYHFFNHLDIRLDEKGKRTQEDIKILKKEWNDKSQIGYGERLSFIQDFDSALSNVNNNINNIKNKFDNMSLIEKKRNDRKFELETVIGSKGGKTRVQRIEDALRTGYDSDPDYNKRL